MLVARDLRIEAGPRTLIETVSFSLQPGDKVGLVGPNGAGKSTLLRTLAGHDQPAEGRVLSQGALGYFSQEAHLPPAEENKTALDRVLEARQLGKLSAEIEAARLRMESLKGAERDKAIKSFSRLRDVYDSRGGYVAEAEAKRTAASVGIGARELNQLVTTMSGGQRRRVELARILFADTDVLLLDEPTNHLDLDAKAWLMDYLRGYSGALLVVSHDLPLLDEAITSVLSVEEGRLEPYRGNYTHYLAERDRRRVQRQRIRKHQEARLSQLDQTVARFIGSTEKMAQRAKSMRTRADKLREQLLDVGGRERRVSLRFPQPEQSGRVPLEGVGLAKEFDDQVVFLDVDVYVERGERLLVMGLNGAGKTTLLRILAGEESADLGEVRAGYRASLGYYAQEHEQIHATANVLDHLRDVSDQPDTVLRSLLGHFLLADKIDQAAGTLSGGEKTKLVLAQLVAARPNVLLLDEPTNNLDPQAKAALLSALYQYEGTVVLVSHDTDFVAELGPNRAVLMPEGDSVYFDESMLELVSLA